MIYDAPLVLMVNSTLPIQSVKDLIAFVKASPGKVNYSSPGNGSVSHLAMSELMRRAGTEMTHVPYQGAAKSLTDLAAGEVQVSFDAYAAAQPFLAGGRARDRGQFTRTHFGTADADSRGEWPGRLRSRAVGRPAGTRRHAGAFVDKVSENRQIAFAGILASDRRQWGGGPDPAPLRNSELRAG